MLNNNRRGSDTNEEMPRERKMTRRERRRKKDKWIDDGRVIADMGVDGMPDTLSETVFGRRKLREPIIDEFGNEIAAPEPIDLTKAEKRSIYLGVTRAFLLFGLGVAAFYTLLMLFLVHVWMR